jgi:hypothetical protein
MTSFFKLLSASPRGTGDSGMESHTDRTRQSGFVCSFRSSDCEIAEAHPFGFFSVSLTRKELAFLTPTGEIPRSP